METIILNKKETDQRIVQLIQTQKDLQYIDILYRKYHKRVFDTCFFYIKDHHKAEDFTQDIFFKVCSKIDTFNSKSSFYTWLFSITRNYCFDHLRKAKKKREVSVFDYWDFVGRLSDEDFYLDYGEKPMPKKITIENLNNVINDVNADDKSIIEMKYLEGMSIKEITDQLQISPSATKMRIKRAKEKVRTRFYKTYGLEMVG